MSIEYRKTDNRQFAKQRRPRYELDYKPRFATSVKTLIPLFRYNHSIACWDSPSVRVRIRYTYLFSGIGLSGKSTPEDRMLKMNSVTNFRRPRLNFNREYQERKLNLMGYAL